MYDSSAARRLAPPQRCRRLVLRSRAPPRWGMPSRERRPRTTAGSPSRRPSVGALSPSSSPGTIAAVLAPLPVPSCCMCRPAVGPRDWTPGPRTSIQDPPGPQVPACPASAWVLLLPSNIAPAHRLKASEVPEKRQKPSKSGFKTHFLSVFATFLTLFLAISGISPVPFHEIPGFRDETSRKQVGNPRFWSLFAEKAVILGVFPRKTSKIAVFPSKTAQKSGFSSQMSGTAEPSSLPQDPREARLAALLVAPSGWAGLGPSSSEEKG